MEHLGQEPRLPVGRHLVAEDEPREHGALAVLFWFQTGDGTRKAKNVARDKRCTGSLSTNEFDLAVNGSAEKVSNAADVARVSAVWVAGGWTCEVDASGIGLTAPFNAPAVGPAPWFVYRITPLSATSVSRIEPGGATRWTF